jgi:hypothetical protein
VRSASPAREPNGGETGGGEPAARVLKRLGGGRERGEGAGVGSGHRSGWRLGLRPLSIAKIKSQP